jgi:hypothetical protein
MIIFVLLNILCFILILSKCIWADKASWNRTTHNIISVFTPYHPQLDLITISDDEKVDESAIDHHCDDCDDCENCSRYNDDSEDGSNDNNPLTDSSISTPSVEPEVELENPENVSAGGSESDDSIVVLDTRIDYLKQAQEIVKGLKEELEKKND